MKFFDVFGGFFQKIGKLVLSALKSAEVKGLTDEVLATASAWATVAANKALSNTEKREFVVQILTGRGIPESIARLAVELAVQAIKAELNK